MAQHDRRDGALERWSARCAANPFRDRRHLAGFQRARVISSYDLNISQDGGPAAALAARTTRERRPSTPASPATPTPSTRSRATPSGNEELAPGSADASTSAANPSPVVETLEPTSGPGGRRGRRSRGQRIPPGLSPLGRRRLRHRCQRDRPADGGRRFPGPRARALHDVTATNTGGCGWTFSKAWFTDFLMSIRRIPSTASSRTSSARASRPGAAAATTARHSVPAPRWRSSS